MRTIGTRYAIVAYCTYWPEPTHSIVRKYNDLFMLSEKKQAPLHAKLKASACQND